MDIMCPTWVLKSGKSEVQFFEDVLLSHVMFVLIHLSAFVLKIITESQFKLQKVCHPQSHLICTVLFWTMVLSGRVESSSPRTSCNSGEHQAPSGVFTTQKSSEHLLISPF